MDAAWPAVVPNTASSPIPETGVFVIRGLFTGIFANANFCALPMVSATFWEPPSLPGALHWHTLAVIGLPSLAVDPRAAEICAAVRSEQGSDGGAAMALTAGSRKRQARAADVKIF